jgi:hypothetical protein
MSVFIGAIGSRKIKSYKVTYKVAELGSNDWRYKSYITKAKNAKEARYFAGFDITEKHPREKIKVIRVDLK